MESRLYSNTRNNGANEAERLGRPRAEALPVPHRPVPGGLHCVWK